MSIFIFSKIAVNKPVKKPCLLQIQGNTYWQTALAHIGTLPGHTKLKYVAKIFGQSDFYAIRTHPEGISKPQFKAGLKALILKETVIVI